MSANTTTERPGRAEDAAHEFDVAIIGHGPVGVTLANLLGTAGVRTLVVERDQDLYDRARAVTVSDWILRTFQDMGIAEECKADMDEFSGVRYKTYDGRTIFRMGLHTPELSQPPGMMIYQPAMEAKLRSVGARLSGLEVRYGHTFTDLDQDADGVTLDLTDDAGRSYQERAKYVVGADGGQSRVRSAVGLKLEGSTRSRRWIVIDGRVRNWWPDCNSLVLWSDTARPMVDIPLAHGNHRWEIPLAETETDADFDTEEKVWALLRPLGIDESHVELKGWAFYSHHVRHVERWRDGRVLLIGDAAHLMPPWAGQGMQSGVRDAANAAFKLALLTDGSAEDSVLDTVESERRPHVETMTRSAVRLGKLVEPDDTSVLGLRNTAMRVVSKVPGFEKVMVSGLDSYRFSDGWATGPTGRNSAVGRMIPQPYVYDRNAVIQRLDDAVGYGMTVLGLDRDPREAMTAVQADAWTRLGARFVTVLDVDGAPGTGSAVIDHTGALRRWMTRFGSRVIAVRPDHFVAASDRTGLDVPTTTIEARQKGTVR